MARFLHLPSPDEIAEEDPLSGIANLFDVSVHGYDTAEYGDERAKKKKLEKTPV